MDTIFFLLNFESENITVRFSSKIRFSDYGLFFLLQIFCDISKPLPPFEMYFSHYM